MPRLFTGIEIPAETMLHLSLLRGGLRGAHWLDTDRYHLTLRFIGDVDQPIANEIAMALSSVRRQDFPLAFNGLSTFGSRKPHSLIATLTPSQALLELQAEQERLMRRLGLPPDTRRYSPHVTLARLHGTASPEVAEYLGLRAGFGTAPFIVDHFVLFSARSLTGGGPYVVEDRYELLSEPNSLSRSARDRR